MILLFLPCPLICKLEAQKEIASADYKHSELNISQLLRY